MSSKRGNLPREPLHEPDLMERFFFFPLLMKSAKLALYAENFCCGSLKESGRARACRGLGFSQAQPRKTDFH